MCFVFIGSSCVTIYDRATQWPYCTSGQCSRQNCNSIQVGIKSVKIGQHRIDLKLILPPKKKV